MRKIGAHADMVERGKGNMLRGFRVGDLNTQMVALRAQIFAGGQGFFVAQRLGRQHEDDLPWLSDAINSLCSSQSGFDRDDQRMRDSQDVALAVLMQST